MKTKQTKEPATSRKENSNKQLMIVVAQSVRATGRHAADAGSIPRCGKGFSSQSLLSVQTPSVSVHPREQSRALKSVRTIKITQSVHVRVR